MNVIQALVTAWQATAWQATANCVRTGNSHWEDRWDQRIEQLEELLPSGSGFDSGSRIVSIQDTRAKFVTCFHHMDDNGYYDGWTHHEVIVTPRFNGIGIRVTGRNRNDIKGYIAEAFHYILTQEAPPCPWEEP